MQIEVRYFAVVRELVGTDVDSFSLSEGAVVRGLADAIESRHPRVAGRLGRVRFAVNEEFVSNENPLADGDIVAVIPPVAGGSDARVSLTKEPLSLDAVLARVRHPGAGALATFVGVVRDQNDGSAVSALEYTAYESMALKEMERVIVEIEAEISGVRLAVAHRIGELAVGDDAVICAASSPHRDEAFRAGRMLIDRIKDRVPIWKRERGPDGATWVNWDESP